MPETKTDLSADDAKKLAVDALDKETTKKVTLESKDGQKWTVTIEP
ncbi:hypothetical protein [Bradyrhizobium amphicarpaeae]|nr:hypothetical protein [Bradyrhizobium amphicarpaeae]